LLGRSIAPFTHFSRLAQARWRKTGNSVSRSPLNLNTAFTNFLEKQAQYLKFKCKLAGLRIDDPCRFLRYRSSAALNVVEPESILQRITLSNPKIVSLRPNPTAETLLDQIASLAVSEKAPLRALFSPSLLKERL
jgi:hypothetical protein